MVQLMSLIVEDFFEALRRIAHRGRHRGLMDSY